MRLRNGENAHGRGIGCQTRQTSLRAVGQKWGGFRPGNGLDRACIPPQSPKLVEPGPTPAHVGQKSPKVDQTQAEIWSKPTKLMTGPLGGFGGEAINAGSGVKQIPRLLDGFTGDECMRSAGTNFECVRGPRSCAVALSFPAPVDALTVRHPIARSCATKGGYYVQVGPQAVTQSCTCYQRPACANIRGRCTFTSKRMRALRFIGDCLAHSATPHGYIVQRRTLSNRWPTTNAIEAGPKGVQ